MSSHKRKRSLHDNTPLDLSNIQRLRALKEELSGIEETIGEIMMEEILTQIDALEVILNTRKKVVRDFNSSFSA